MDCRRIIAVHLLALLAGWAGLSCQDSGVMPPGTDDTPGLPLPDDPVVPDPNDPPGDDPVNTASYRARVRNESPSRADVTLRFIRENAVVHLAFVRVLPNTVTTVTSPETAGLVEVSGIDASGRALSEKSLEFKAAGSDVPPVEYTISIVPPVNDPDPVNPEPDPPTIALVEPSNDVEVVIGTAMQARWNDESAAAGAVVRVMLRPTGQTAHSALVSVGPAVGAALDGLNDQLSFIVQGVSPGRYDVVAEIDDGKNTAIAVAPGKIIAKEDPTNAAPKLTILAPAALVERREGEALQVEWRDEDPDDNATITFSLIPSSAGDSTTGAFGISPPIAEDPDGGAHDRATLIVSGLPGLYDLLGTIDDGSLSGTSRVAAAVRLVPSPANDPPTFSFTAPNGEVNVETGRVLTVRWTDSDANNDAKISLLLDPEFGAVDLDGNEVLLVTGLSEDADGAADQIVLGIPEELPSGTYALVAVITDGQTQLVTRASATLFITKPEPSGGPGGEPNPTQARRIIVDEPSSAQFVRLGAVIPIQVRLVNLPSNTPIRIFLSGQDERGDALDLDLTPPGFVPGTVAQVQIPSDESRIPNKWWPRQFILGAEAVVSGVRYEAKALGSVWIRQEVRVRSVRMINYWCFDQDSQVRVNSPFFGLEVDWYGGGFDVSDPGGIPRSAFGDVPQDDAPVRFWLAMDGVIPPNALDDSAHRLIYTAPPSPNAVQTMRIHYTDLVGIEFDDLGQPPGELDPALDDGIYPLLAVTEAELFGTIVTGPDFDPVEVCFPLPVGP